MNGEAILLQLDAMRATGESLLAQIDVMKALFDVRPTSAGCEHPTDQRVSAAVMGHPDRFICGVCKETVDP